MVGSVVLPRVKSYFAFPKYTGLHYSGEMTELN